MLSCTKISWSMQCKSQDSVCVMVCLRWCAFLQSTADGLAFVYPLMTQEATAKP